MLIYSYYTYIDCAGDISVSVLSSIHLDLVNMMSRYATMVMYIIILIHSFKHSQALCRKLKKVMVEVVEILKGVVAKTAEERGMVNCRSSSSLPRNRH